MTGEEKRRDETSRGGRMDRGLKSARERKMRERCGAAKGDGKQEPREGDESK